jgi:hypothetical protein
LPQELIVETPRKKLKKQVKRLQSAKWKLSNRIKKLMSKKSEEDKKKNRNINIKEIAEAAGEYMTPLQKSLFEAQ